MIARDDVVVGRHMLLRAFIAAAALWAMPCLASADPCRGELPDHVGAQFSGFVRYVSDGDSLCVGEDDDPNTWIEVRLGDFNAPELSTSPGSRAKTILQSLVLGRYARCEAVIGVSGRVRSYDRVTALCRVGRRSIGDMMRAANAPSG